MCSHCSNMPEEYHQSVYKLKLPKDKDSVISEKNCDSHVVLSSVIESKDEIIDHVTKTVDMLERNVLQLVQCAKMDSLSSKQAKVELENTDLKRQLYISKDSNSKLKKDLDTIHKNSDSLSTSKLESEFQIANT